MSVTPAELKAKLTEFSSTDDNTVQSALDEAERRTNRDAWGVKADDGVTYLAGHLLKAYALQSAMQPAAVQSETVGPIERTFAVSLTSSANNLNTTAWGRMYLELRATLFVPRVA
jgi:hypothetical protein